MNTAIFSVATGLSRIAGLVREVVAARYFGTTGPMSAFTLAFQVPNLVRALFADAALSAAFVPVFTELLEHKRRPEALQLAGALFGLILAVLGVITVVFIALAGVIMPLFTGPEFTQQLDDLTVGLSRVLFPIVIVLGLNGLLVGVLNAHDHFTIPALSPLVWNLVIIAGLVFLTPLFEGDEEIYAYAIGVLAGTACQFAMAFPVLRRLHIPIRVSFRWRDPRIKRILLLMLPVTIGLGLINFNLLINSILGSRVSEQAPAAIDKAFRIYMLPQGMFSVAVATVLFPTLSRLVARQDFDGLRRTQANGMRQIALLLIPAAAVTIALPEPITRLVYERGAFNAASTDQTAEALFWFSFSLPFSGFNLLLTRTFFSLQRPWTPTALAGVTLVINIAVSAALYGPLGIAGVVLGTVAATAAMTVGQAFYLRRRIGGLQLGTTLKAVARILVAAAVLGGVAYGSWYALDQALGRSFAAQLVSVGGALALASGAYAAVVLALRVPEARQIVDLFAQRFRRAS
ncbi:MAG TPA: murein biosynthesis integral membrane protein MurJ [Solirubrobacteraceae bacterium]|nr:murein biosynthesis integral membrane protein MurJ [Solirubrobacteraceae bacterium]